MLLKPKLCARRVKNDDAPPAESSMRSSLSSTMRNFVLLFYP